MSKREEKYKDTASFHFYNANSHNHYSGDCVIRALCTAMNQSWEQTLSNLYDIGIKYGYVPTDKHVIEKYLSKNGWVKHKQPKHSDNTKYTGEEFCEFMNWLNSPDTDYLSNVDANIIANIGGNHIVAINPTNDFESQSVLYKIWDTWDSSDGCIGNYWSKK